MQKNNVINILKFIFSIIILLLHSKNLVSEDVVNNSRSLFSNGAIAVEFFFIVSGYYFANSLFRGGNSPQSFMLKKIKNFMLPVWCSWIVSFVCIHIIEQNMQLIELVRGFMDSLVELLMIRRAGFTCVTYNAPSWYISSLLLTMLLIVIPLYKYRDKYIYIVAPAIGIFLLGYLCHKYKHIRTPGKWSIIMYKGQIRAIAEVNLGIFVYGLKQYIDNIHLTKLGKCLLTIIEGGLYVTIILFMQYGHASIIDFSVILLLAIAVLISMTQNTYIHDWARHLSKPAEYLGKFSLYVYLNQALWCKILPILFPDMKYAKICLVYVIATFITAYFVMKTVDLIRKKGIPKLKAMLVYN